jgi:hypothetical protein
MASLTSTNAVIVVLEARTAHLTPTASIHYLTVSLTAYGIVYSFHLKDYDSTLDKYAAVAVAAVAAGLVAWFVSTRILRIGGR